MHRSASCGGDYSGLNGTISSPNYPSNYTNNVGCGYTITVPSGVACLEFENFATESCCDYVTIIEGVTQTEM